MVGPEAGAGMPPVVSAEAWQAAIAHQRVQEKALTRHGDLVAAARRRLPMMRVESAYEFDGPEGPVTLSDLFADRPQLIVYHFMFGEDWGAGCNGCSWVVDAMSHPAHIRGRDASIAVISRAKLDKLLAYRKRMGWNIDWYSSNGSTFNDDMGVTVNAEESHGVSVFLRNGDEIYRTYFTEDRGVEHLGSHWTYLDLLPWGRQEPWEDSPPDWPQSEAYAWQRRHDEY